MALLAVVVLQEVAQLHLKIVLKLGLMVYVLNAPIGFTILMAFATKLVINAILGIQQLEPAQAAMEVINYQVLLVF